MVFFVCEGCGETMNRKQVDKHSARCRAQGVVCVDCSQTFYDNYVQVRARLLSHSRARLSLIHSLEAHYVCLRGGEVRKEFVQRPEGDS
jgi:hypothetical protein